MVGGVISDKQIVWKMETWECQLEFDILNEYF